MFGMRNWILMFLALFVSILFIPLLANSASKENESAKLTVFEEGEIFETDIEDYALRVLLGEGDVCESLESKKALAVSARTLGAYFSVFGCKHEDFSACADGSCCLTLGNPNDANEDFLEDCKTAVLETRGEILTLDNLPTLALFCFCSGSGTAQSDEFLYLTPTKRANKCEKHLFSQVFDKEGAFESVTDKNSFAVYTENEKCDFLILNGKKLSALDLITETGIHSTEFKIWIDDGKILAETSGVGHGFGLDLCGSEEMAKNGSNYKEILGFYYPKLVLNKIF